MTDSSRITTERIKRLLTAFARSEPPEEDALDFTFFDDALTQAERFIEIRDIMRQHAEQRLQYYRQALRQKTTAEQDVEQQIAADSIAESIHLQAWSAIYYRYLKMDGLSSRQLQQMAGINERRLQRRVEQGIRYLTQMIQEKDRLARAGHLRLQMPAAGHHMLYGLEAALSRITRLLGDHEYRFISLEGLGGIGKTALAWSVVDRLRQQQPADIHGIEWLSARNEILNDHGQIEVVDSRIHSMQDIFNRLADRLPGHTTEPLTFEKQREKLASGLNRHPYLVVIDNLETVEDSDLLLPELEKIAGQSRFILTSRVSLQHFPYVHSIRMSELSQFDSYTLLKEEVFRLSRRSLSDQEARRIYEMVGGFPLALRLISGQLAELPTETVIESLEAIRGPLPDDQPQSTLLHDDHATLFRFIYRTTWQRLDDACRLLLLALYDISTDGINLEGMQTRATHLGLSNRQFVDTLRTLQRHALLEFRGDVPRYSLHRLTLTFLKRDILHPQWQL
ncbi:MAG: NB-ARC domain-containing protein [Anaerolineae bacterium]|jgi:hypothetical protein|nr:NB-ARC domain-containing protein [Anaerolineae bacterium]